jgi:hypothetical protein
MRKRAESTSPAGQRSARPRARYRIAGLIGVLLLIGGGSALGVAASAQQHAPQPAGSAAGAIGPAGVARPAAKAAPLSLARSAPVSLDIPAIGVQSELLHLGLNPNGSLQVPPLFVLPSEAAWYKYSATPGQIGPSIIEGHVDTYEGPSVFFRLGALVPGDKVDVTLADGTVAIFRVSGVRSYPKTDWPWRVIFGSTKYAALRLITCGGTFDYATGHYLSNTVVFASLVSSKPATGAGAAPR